MSDKTRHSMAAILLTIALLFTSYGSPASATYNVDAPNWIIFDVASERTLSSQAMHEPVPLASLTKMMTALLVVEHLSMEDEITIVEEDQVGEASIWAEDGDTYTVETLLHGLLMRSGNDAAAALARAVGGSPDEDDDSAREAFTRMMNARASQLGMLNTSFENPHGLDGDRQYSTAFDLMLLTNEVMEHPELMDALGAEIYSGEGFDFGHTNQLPEYYDGVLGGKTGWTTQAGLCLIQIVEKDGRTLIVVLLGSSFERWYEDAIDLLDYGWKLPGVPRPNHDFGPTQWDQA